MPGEDIKPPVIEIYEPVNGGYYNTSSIEIEYRVVDGTGVDRVYYKITCNGETIIENGTGSYVDIIVDLPYYSNYILVVDATDIYGNNASLSIWFIVDTIEPTIDITYVYPSTTTSTDKVLVLWSGSDNYFMRKYSIYVDGELVLERLQKSMYY